MEETKSPYAYLILAYLISIGLIVSMTIVVYTIGWPNVKEAAFSYYVLLIDFIVVSILFGTYLTLVRERIVIYILEGISEEAIILEAMLYSFMMLFSAAGIALILIARTNFLEATLVGIMLLLIIVSLTIKVESKLRKAHRREKIRDYIRIMAMRGIEQSNNIYLLDEQRIYVPARVKEILGLNTNGAVFIEDLLSAIRERFGEEESRRLETFLLSESEETVVIGNNKSIIKFSRDKDEGHVITVSSIEIPKDGGVAVVKDEKIEKIYGHKEIIENLEEYLKGELTEINVEYGEIMTIGENSYFIRRYEDLIEIIKLGPEGIEDVHTAIALRFFSEMDAITHIGICVYKKDIILYVNDTFLETLDINLKKDEILGKSIWSILPPEVSQRLLDIILSTKMPINRPIRIISPQDSSKDITISIFPISRHQDVNIMMVYLTEPRADISREIISKTISELIEDLKLSPRESIAILGAIKTLMSKRPEKGKVKFNILRAVIPPGRNNIEIIGNANIETDYYSFCALFILFNMLASVGNTKILTNGGDIIIVEPQMDQENLELIKKHLRIESPPRRHSILWYSLRELLRMGNVVEIRDGRIKIMLKR